LDGWRLFFSPPFQLESWYYTIHYALRPLTSSVLLYFIWTDGACLYCHRLKLNSSCYTLHYTLVRMEMRLLHAPHLHVMPSRLPVRIPILQALLHLSQWAEFARRPWFCSHIMKSSCVSSNSRMKLKGLDKSLIVIFLISLLETRCRKFPNTGFWFSLILVTTSSKCGTIFIDTGIYICGSKCNGTMGLGNLLTMEFLLSCSWELAVGFVFYNNLSCVHKFSITNYSPAFCTSILHYVTSLKYSVWWVGLQVLV
jgi:hypothetical protein